MPLLSAVAALRDKYAGPQYVSYPLTQVALGDAIVLDVEDRFVTINRKDLAKVSLWAPEGVLRVPEVGATQAAPHICPRPSAVSAVFPFLAGCLLGAAMLAAPVTTLIIAISCCAYLLLSGLNPRAA